MLYWCTKIGLPISRLPMICFLLAVLISCASGSSGASFFALMPTLLPMAASIGFPAGLCVAAICGGGQVGDNLAPISDNLVVSSAALNTSVDKAFRYDNEEAVRRMFAEQRDMKVPPELVPRCPVCGKPMAMNLRADDTFVQDGGWHAAARRYEDFVQRHKDCAVIYLELGVGMNTPGIIKYNFWQQVRRNPNASYVCINRRQAYAPGEIGGRSICLDADIGAVLSKL